MDETNPFEVDNCKSKYGALVSDALALLYCSSDMYINWTHHAFKVRIESSFHREGTVYLVCDDKIAFFTSDDQKRFKLWSCQKVCDASIYLLDNIFIIFDTKLD